MMVKRWLRGRGEKVTQARSIGAYTYSREGMHGRIGRKQREWCLGTGSEGAEGCIKHPEPPLLIERAWGNHKTHMKKELFEKSGL